MDTFLEIVKVLVTLMVLMVVGIIITREYNNEPTRSDIFDEKCKAQGGTPVHDHALHICVTGFINIKY